MGFLVATRGEASNSTEQSSGNNSLVPPGHLPQIPAGELDNADVVDLKLGDIKLEELGKNTPSAQTTAAALKPSSAQRNKRMPRAVRDDELSVDDLREKAAQASGRREHEEALRYTSTAIEKAPDKLWLYYDKGVSESKLGRYEDAIQSFSQELGRCQSDDMAMLILTKRAFAYKSLGRFDEYEMDLKQTVDLFKNIQTVETEIHLDYLEQTYSDVKEEIDRRTSELRRGAEYEFERGNIEAALQLTTRSIALNPEQPWRHNDKGFYEAKLGRHADAIESFSKELEVSAQNPDIKFIALYSRAEVKRIAGVGGHQSDLEAAVAEFGKIKAPDDTAQGVLKNCQETLKKLEEESSTAIDPVMAIAAIGALGAVYQALKSKQRTEESKEGLVATASSLSKKDTKLIKRVAGEAVTLETLKGDHPNLLETVTSEELRKIRESIKDKESFSEICDFFRDDQSLSSGAKSLFQSVALTVLQKKLDLSARMPNLGDAEEFSATFDAAAKEQILKIGKDRESERPPAGTMVHAGAALQAGLKRGSSHSSRG